MSIPQSPTSSAYAGGTNSPIASAKRPRAMRPDMHSPAKDLSLPVTDVTKQSKVSTELLRASGSLFSPNLHEEDNDKKEGDKKEATNTDNTSEEDDDIFNPYLFISSLPPHLSVRVLRVCLPPQSALNRKRTLVLDLDETLVHCGLEKIENPDLTFPLDFNGAHYDVYVRKRPYLHYFLEAVSKIFEVVIFTASQEFYANILLDLLDPTKTLISHRVFRDSCLFVHGNFIKDLSVLNRDLKKTVLVDNSPHAYAYNLTNGIPIESWFDDNSDTELLKLLGFLEKLDVDDVREVVKAHFNTEDMVRRAAMGIPQSTSAPPF